MLAVGFLFLQSAHSNFLYFEDLPVSKAFVRSANFCLSRLSMELEKYQTPQ